MQVKTRAFIIQALSQTFEIVLVKEFAENVEKQFLTNTNMQNSVYLGHAKIKRQRHFFFHKLLYKPIALEEGV